ncbi:glycoside hydrolase family 16 protein [Phellopilus nigrolimitatus]|nr:glycoside hydrolase family 16 protein [Phellopilus nigrolimitatus]
MSPNQDQVSANNAYDTGAAQTRPLLHEPSSEQFSPFGSPRSMSPRPTVNSVARGAIGTGYGPYTYERGSFLSDSAASASSRSSPHPPPINEKLSHSSPLTPASRRAALTDTTANAGMPIYMWHTTEPEEDDALHAPEMRRGDRNAQPFVLCSARGWLNAGALGLLLAAVLMLFLGYPVLLHVRDKPFRGPGFNLGGINGSGQIPDLPGMPHLVDKETPKEAMSRTGTDGKTYNLVFSDEFNTDGRSFYPGDDPYWEAQDLQYWATGDLEWYSPDAITTQGGKLVITMANTPNHGLNYSSGMLTSWNKFCFTTGYIEVSVSLPGSGAVAGLWPGVWTMGNLGRAGYGATTDGMWPYSYDSCDLGTYPGQQDKAGNPVSSSTDGWNGAALSTTPGQRLSACTCPGSDHPGPTTNGGYRGRGVDTTLDNGEVSQSFQIAPFNANVKFNNATPATTLYDDTVTHFNPFTGTALQQAVSAVSLVDNSKYNGSGYATYGFEYWSDMANRDDGYVTWYSQGQTSWKITSASIGPDSTSEVSQRLIAEEPMYIVMNLGMSPSWEAQDFAHLVFPSKMYIDYVRVYQRSDVKDGVTCDPPNHPTTDYINAHPNAYLNPNWTTWASAGYSYPRNSQYDGC